ncbi:MAG: hypothetical protein ABI443_03425, partial [Chthoniobacterales bacterium]
MNDEPSVSADLSGIDLSLSFAPAWAKEAGPSKQVTKLVAKHGDKNYEERPDRRGSGDRGFQRDRPQGQGRRDNKSRDGKDR